MAPAAGNGRSWGIVGALALDGRLDGGDRRRQQGCRSRHRPGAVEQTDERAQQEAQRAARLEARLDQGTGGADRLGLLGEGAAGRDRRA